ncbi:MAG: hypothetical protein ACXWJN_04460 [Methyloceanibacter sp.]
MSSVIVAWKGSCRDVKIRNRLLGHLQRLAKQSDDYLRSNQPERPVFLNLLSEQRGGDLRPRANIEAVNRPISGPILVSSFISASPEALVESAREAGLTVIDRQDGAHAPLIAMDKGKLVGLDFKLFDPRGLYPGEDRMSFVFLECKEHPFLDGRLVEIASIEDCPTGEGETLPAATAYLANPSIHLHYFLEDWSDCLFSWMKFFFIGDFWWHRCKEMQGYGDYRGVFHKLQAERGGEEAEEASFEAVLGTFSQHAEHWIAEVEGWARSEQG